MASIDSAMLNGLLFGLFLAISVGPTLFALIKYSLHYSYKAGIAFVIGVSVSDICSHCKCRYFVLTGIKNL